MRRPGASAESSVLLPTPEWPTNNVRRPWQCSNTRGTPWPLAAHVASPATPARALHQHAVHEPVFEVGIPERRHDRDLVEVRGHDLLLLALAARAARERVAARL